jgi:hypothetical protein
VHDLKGDAVLGGLTTYPIETSQLLTSEGQVWIVSIRKVGHKAFKTDMRQPGKLADERQEFARQTPVAPEASIHLDVDRHAPAGKAHFSSRLVQSQRSSHSVDGQRQVI